MLRQIMLFAVVVFAFAGTVAAQDGGPAQLRVLQLTYIPEGSASADIEIGDAARFESVTWPFATDYVELAPGEHSIMAAIGDALAQTTVTVAAGERYSLIISGAYDDNGPTFVMIDETGLLDETGSAFAVANLTDQTITGVMLDDELAIENVTAGGTASFALPVAGFTLSGNLGDDSYSETFTPQPNTLLTILVLPLTSGDIQILQYRSSPLTVTEYLLEASDGASAADVAALMSEDGSYTAFLPVDAPMPDGAGFAASVVAASLPPYLLPEHDTLTALDGSTYALRFADTASGYWEIEGAPILWDLRLADGVIYAIDGVIVQ